ncbi:hypothetical protein H311_03796 [Anncaliia algerae PRA109]|nr:hypothetical protein H311_03796 [Anncaliia algerae PRA109]
MNSKAKEKYPKYNYYQSHQLNNCHQMNNLTSTISYLIEGLSEMSFKNNLTFETLINDQKGPSITLKKLEFLDPNTILPWIKQVKILFEINKADNKTAMAILRVLLDTNLHYIVDNSEDPEVALDKIIKEAFPKDDFSIYDRILKNLKTTNFDSITKFYSDFIKFINMANSCLTKKGQLTTREIEAYFTKALTKKQRYHLVNIDDDSIQAKVNHLFKIENLERRYIEDVDEGIHSI